MIIIIILTLTVLTGLFSFAYHLTGALLTAAVWVCFRLPLALMLGVVGVICCMTLLLIPVGRSLLRTAGRILF